MRGIGLFVLGIIFGALSLSAHAQTLPPGSAPSPQISIWFEQRVGHVVVSVRRNNSRVEANLAYVFYMAAIGPRPATATREYGGCLKQAVRDAGISFIEALDEEAALFVPVIEPIFSKDQITRTQNALITARGEYKRSVIRSCRSIGQTDPLRKYVDGSRLALVKRECTAALCPGLNVPESTLTEDSISEGERRERVFEAIYYWSLSKGYDTALNRPLLLEFTESGGLAPKSVETRPGLSWPERLPPDRIQALLEAGIARVVADPTVPPLSSVIPAQIALPKKTVLRTALAFRDPQDAWSLGADGDEFKLKFVQDEVARIRLTECKVYRGLPDVSAVARCAGYELDNSALLECLNGGPCMPTFAEAANAGAVLQSARRRVSDLGADAFVPRPYTDAVGSFGTMVDTYKACASDGEATDAAACLARQVIPSKISTQANCLLDRTGADRLECLVPEGTSGRALKQLQQCFDRNGRGCAAEAVLPPEWACVAGAQSVEDLQCLADGVGGETARVARCLATQSDVAQRIVCISGDSIPEPVQRLVGCYSSVSTEAGIAACAIGGSLPPEQAAIVKCAAESGGDIMAAGVCVAAPILNLNPGQQIILQCAASSGGVPATAAACIVGRFTLNELNGCKSANFGESGCFGEGNEFQKLAKLITGDKISKDSVVGQITIHYIKVANAAIAGAGHALNELSKGGRNTIEGFGHELEKIRKSPVEALADAPGNIARETEKGVRNVFKALDPGKIRIKL